MRLTDYQKNRIVDVIKRNFKSATGIYLFGSRTDDTMKGGDIDLLVMVDDKSSDLESRIIKSVTGIQFAIGDQKIDLVVTDNPVSDPRLVVREAVRTGVRIG